MEFLRKFSSSFQKHLAAMMCRDTRVMSRLHDLIDPDFFDDKVIGDIVASASDHYRINKELLSRPALRELFISDMTARKLISGLYKANLTDPEHVINKSVEFAKIQAAMGAVHKCAEIIDDVRKGGNSNPVDMLTLMKDALAVGENFSDLGVFVNRDFDTVVREMMNPERRKMVKTGLRYLDKCMKGGLGGGELGVILAPPKTGKSFLMANIAYGMARKENPTSVNVVYFSLEMNQSELAKRVIARLAGKNVNMIMESDPKQFRRRILQRKEKELGGEIIIKNYPTRGAGVSTFRSHLNNLVAAGYPFGAVIVDYADIAKPERRIGEMRHEQAGIYEDLRGLAGEFNVPIWTGSQATRGSLNKDVIDMSDVAESFEKIAIADAVIAICRTPEEKRDGKGRLFMAALRAAPMDRVVECIFDYTNAYIRTLSVSSGCYVPQDEEYRPSSRRTKKRLSKEGLEQARVANVMKGAQA